MEIPCATVIKAVSWDERLEIVQLAYTLDGFPTLAVAAVYFTLNSTLRTFTRCTLTYIKGAARRTPYFDKCGSPNAKARSFLHIDSRDFLKYDIVFLEI